mmetsp:Transcript_7877/g.22404  ORF Transcript_7877/g.22404 Transcript_7877/m.22404 type:complete len:296 (+) Transcript_7877:534-1421(+)
MEQHDPHANEQGVVHESMGPEPLAVVGESAPQPSRLVGRHRKLGAVGVLLAREVGQAFLGPERLAHPELGVPDPLVDILHFAPIHVQGLVIRSTFEVIEASVGTGPPKTRAHGEVDLACGRVPKVGVEAAEEGRRDAMTSYVAHVVSSDSQQGLVVALAQLLDQEALVLRDAHQLAALASSRAEGGEVEPGEKRVRHPEFLAHGVELLGMELVHHPVSDHQAHGLDALAVLPLRLLRSSFPLHHGFPIGLHLEARRAVDHALELLAVRRAENGLTCPRESLPVVANEVLHEQVVV